MIIIETKLAQYKDNSNRIKELEFQNKTMKTEMVTEYFNDHQEYRTPAGLVLATYSIQVSKRFDSARFKEEHPELYEKYQVESVFDVLRVK